MTPVYQNIIDPGTGNCLQAVVASFLDRKLEDVPHFILDGERWFSTMYNYMYDQGYSFDCFLYNKNELGHTGKDEFEAFKSKHKNRKKLKYFIATVYSPKYFNAESYCMWPRTQMVSTHAVIMDHNFDIVHDPNIDYRGIEYPMEVFLGYNGIIRIYLFNKIKKKK